MNSILQADSISFRYPQNQHGFGPFSLSLQPGESILISGLSGSGKSTLARCLTGIIPHLYRGDFQGKVSLNGMPTDQTPLWRLSEIAGFIFQNPSLQILAPTVEEEIIFGLENLGLSRNIMQDRLEEALSTFGLIHLRSRSPQTLSGGEQQKLALAAVMARKPDLLVLDEPLSMLDTTSATELVDHLVKQTRTGLSTVVFEHREAYLRTIPGLRVETLANPSISEMNGPEWEQNTSYPVQTLIIEQLMVELGKHQILKGLNLNLQSGQIVALVGPNGVGKTTFLRTLAGFEAFQGKIHLSSQPEKPGFSIVFQNPDVQLFNATVRAEILYQLPQPDMRWYQWLMSMLDLQRYEEVPPLLLSEGEKRRVALATVLMRHPQNGILLDEPALGLDTVHKGILLRLLRALAKQGMFVLFSTHDLELAAQADHLILLGNNGIVAEGLPVDVFQNDTAWPETGLLRPAWMEMPA